MRRMIRAMKVLVILLMELKLESLQNKSKDQILKIVQSSFTNLSIYRGFGVLGFWGFGEIGRAHV